MVSAVAVDQLAKITLQKIIPDVDADAASNTMEAGQLWADRPALLLVVRRTVSQLYYR
jgi:hypothetical protein